MLMLPIVIVFCAAVFIIFILISASRSRRNSDLRYAGQKRMVGRVNQFAPWPSTPLPEALGVPAGHPARTAAERLEQALDEHFESRVKDRVLKGHTRLADRQWEWTWFELKRYFLLCGIARGVPMYSAQADELWHEMLMFKREYEQFCDKFCGAMIHHAPHEPGLRPEASDRAWFDWLYGELFPASPVSGRVWGAFYRMPLSGRRLQELSTISREQMKENWFNAKSAARFADLDETVEYLIRRVKQQVDAAAIKERQEGTDWAGSGHPNSALGGVGLLSGMLIFHSMTNPQDYVQEMDRLQTEEQRRDNGGGSSGTNCSSVHDDREADNGDTGDSGGHDSGGDSGGSSCSSSCGGGCSS